MGKKFERQREKYKIGIIAVLLAINCSLVYYFHAVYQSEVVFSHFFYISIILACIWWKRKGLTVAVFSSACLILGHIFLTPNAPAGNDYFCAMMFIAVALIVTALSEHAAKAEMTLRESEEKYRTLTENSLTGVFIQQDGKYVFVNDRFAAIHAYEPEELLGKEYCLLIHPDERGRIAQFVSERLEGNEVPQQYEMRRLKKDGQTIWCEIMVSRIEYMGKPAIMGNIIDTTACKKTEEVLEGLNKDLESAARELNQSNKELQDFAHVTAHDLKSPLRAIRTLADWIATDYGDKFDERGKEQVKLLVGRAERMTKLIDGILQYSEVGHTVHKEKEVDLNILLTEVIREINPPENIEISIDNELPAVISEETRMIQIFQNLLSNAVKYMDKPQGQIKVGCVEEDGFWKFSVADNGPGIEERYFERIFQIFQRVEQHDKFESTGVGLTVIKKIVELYDGKVWVESKAGEGSTFFFTFPKQEMRAKNAQLEACITC